MGLIKLISPPEATYDRKVDANAVRDRVVIEDREEPYTEDERQMVKLVSEQLAAFHNAEFDGRRYHVYSLISLAAGAFLGVVGVVSIANGFLTEALGSPLVDLGVTSLMLAMVAFYAFIGLQMGSTRAVRNQMQAVLIAHPIAGSPAAEGVIDPETREFITSETGTPDADIDALAGLEDRIAYASEMNGFTQQLTSMEQSHAQQRHLAVFALVCAALFQGAILLL